MLLKVHCAFLWHLKETQKEIESISFFSFFLKCPYLLAGVVPPVGTCPECMVCSTIQSIKKWGARLVIAFLPVTTINLGMKKSSAVENHFHSMQVLVTVLTPFRHSWKELLVTFDQEASHFWPCVIDSKRISNEWTVSYVKTLISWQRPKKAKFSIWVPKLTLALCWKRILPRRSTRQKIIHQVVNKRMQDFTICIKM